MATFRSKLIRGINSYYRRLMPAETFVPEVCDDDLAVIHEVTPFTMTSPERICALITAVRYLVANNIPGDIVECGVWKGGSMMTVAKTLMKLKASDRHLHLFDTFAGMTAPSEKDSTRFERRDPDELYAANKTDSEVCQWAYASLEETQRNMLSTGYAPEKIHFVKGPVEQTLPENAPQTIALLRLDTDFYESSKHEMIHLFPRLVFGGVLILDDYGHWEGQRLAVDEYIAQNKIKLLLMRVDYTGRVGLKS